MRVFSKKILKYIFYILIAFYASLITLYFSRILTFIILELYEGLPVIGALAIMYYCVVDSFTPNAKHSSMYGWFYAELLEHVFFPLTLFIILTTFAPIFMIAYIILIFYFYGFVSGEIKTFKDSVKIAVLIVLFVFLSFYPDITLFINVQTGVGYLFIISSVLATAISYFIGNIITKEEAEPFFKGYSILMVSVIFSCLLVRTL